MQHKQADNFKCIIQPSDTDMKAIENSQQVEMIKQQKTWRGAVVGHYYVMF